MSPSAVRTEGLVRRFGQITAVDRVDIDVAPGEIYGFLGPNGAGKSTFIRMLCTLLVPSAGEARVGGFDVATEPLAVRLRIGAALQEAALDDKLTGSEQLAVQARVYGLRSREVRRRIRAVMPLLDPAWLRRRIATYSGGMRRRLDLATALIHNPEIVFLDEPTTGLDPQGRVAVWDEIRRLNREDGLTVFLTTQYLEEADSLADRVGIIDRGRLVAEGTPNELKERLGDDVIVARVASDPAVARDVLATLPGITGVEARGNEVYVRTERGSEMISPVAVALAARRIDVVELALRRPTLDDVFVELTGGHLGPSPPVSGPDHE